MLEGGVANRDLFGAYGIKVDSIAHRRLTSPSHPFRSQVRGSVHLLFWPRVTDVTPRDRRSIDETFVSPLDFGGNYKCPGRI